ncbi:pilus assembly protein FimV [Inhella inkyongensis]|uniref:Pilus assembly protein FimV n=1 Tax=Inhella inkyongensis TaxID=392593 RepID=A0A840SB19_9BURK|nr:FimV/HubP family polar landmark protein [Inhella inkyongensis]MBB5205560.1 pilus assembly protein FimV [Inhella inkyongensis]
MNHLAPLARMRFNLSHVAVAALCALATNAHALGLGRLNVQSALGETLKAEIELSSLSAEEAASLRVRVAAPDAYRASGLEYNAVLPGTQVQLTRRADGRPVLRLVSDRAVQEPFLDVVLELNWSTGRLTREFTLLFDPPQTHRAAEAPTAPVVSAPAPSPQTLAASRAPAPSPTPEAPKPAPRPTAEAAPAPAGDGTVLVRPGDSLSRVAARHTPQGVSLDQMLVALYRQNPQAFVAENMNLLKAGSRLRLPGSEALAGLSAQEAKQVIRAHSQNFEAARQGLAATAPRLPEASERAAKGGVEAVVSEPKAASSGDRLTLSKPSAPVAASKPATPVVAAAPAPAPAPAPVPAVAPVASAPASQVAALTRNVDELKQLTEAASAAAATGSAASAVASAPIALPKPPVQATAPQPKPAVAEPEGGLMDLLLSPLGLLGTGLVVALGAVGVMRLRKPKNAENRETMFGESRLQPDSFFGVTGGQRVDTRDGGNSVSSMSYSLSQLDAHGDVDPVAEADVYLAYGRDLQAEEILKEALRAQPERLAIRLKLLEVYAKRRDVRGFEQLALQLYAESKGEGEDWDKAQEMGRGIDADNPLYQPGGGPRSMFDEDAPRAEPMNAPTMPHAGAPLTEAPEADAGPASLIDLDLDLGGDSDSLERTQSMPSVPSALPEVSMDLDLDLPAAAPAAAASDNSLEFNLDELGDFDAGTVAQSLDAPLTDPADASAAKVGGDSLIDAMQDLADDDGDPMQRQLELADEFRQIGDVEGARDVLQELIKQVGSGPLYDKAKAMLDELR